MTTYTCNKCGNAHAADNVCAVCIHCYEALTRKLAIATACLEALREAKLFAAMDALKKMEECK